MLSINFSELVLTIISFFILLYLLNRFLYTPVLKFMDARKARLDASLANECAAQTALDALAEDIDARKAAQRDVCKQVLDAQRREDAKAQAELVKELHAESATARREAKATVDALAGEVQQQLAAQRQELAHTLADKLLNK